jgi:hypothetical protein
MDLQRILRIEFSAQIHGPNRGNLLILTHTPINGEYFAQFPGKTGAILKEDAHLFDLKLFFNKKISIFWPKKSFYSRSKNHWNLMGFEPLTLDFQNQVSSQLGQKGLFCEKF